MKRYIRASKNLDGMTIGGVDFHLDTYYVYKDGALYRNVSAGQILDRTRPTRIAGKYKIYVSSFPDAAWPYSVYSVADTETGDVYRGEAPQYLSGTLKGVVEALKQL